MKTLTIVQKQFDRPNVLHFFARQHRPFEGRLLIFTLLLTLDRSLYILHPPIERRVEEVMSDMLQLVVNVTNQAGEFLSASEPLKAVVGYITTSQAHIGHYGQSHFGLRMT